MLASLPSLSIVIPTYQQGRYIQRTLESILDQGYPALELIVIDGGSTDQTREIIERYQTHIAIYISEKDGGQSDANTNYIAPTIMTNINENDNKICYLLR